MSFLSLLDEKNPKSVREDGKKHLRKTTSGPIFGKVYEGFGKIKNGWSNVFLCSDIDMVFFSGN